MNKAIIVFTRVPVPGHTKTRLMPYFTGEECAKLHSCFLKDIGAECKKTGVDLFVFYTDDNKEENIWKEKRKVLASAFGREAKYCLQKGENLGERMYGAIEQVLNQGYESCILIGSDIPEIRQNDMEMAFRLLEEKDVVFGPTKDGGYYLVGMKEPRKEVFGIGSYGHGKVLADTLKELEIHGLSVSCIRALSDADTPEDIKAYRNRMRTEQHLQKTCTGRYLAGNTKISIIIPIYNEEKTIEKLQKQLYYLKEQCEIIFVDGGCTDRTLELISPEFKVIHSGKGRAVQMNTGAKASHGDVLFFLHCDSELPGKPLELIREVMRSHRAGCFGIAFHSKSFFMLTCRIISNLRVFDRKVMFGDQGIYIDRDLFFELGMFPEIPIMEDYQFSLTLKEANVKLGMARRRIYTSDRRFPKETIPKLRVMWKMNRLRKMYRDGVDIETISDMYRDIR